ncbi:FG-GAP repeat protein [Streptomyces sp. NPDC086080]|uniref:FG-GAP repeat protein n=1 Tax=Streptomyces sp. NPDC086080 TaxID=3365748 RepID=UPI0037CD2EE2
MATLGEQISGSSDRGSIHVLYGPIDDAPAAGGYVDSGNITGIGEFAGSSLALGHFNDDDYTDVAVGVSDEEVGDEGAAGRLAVLYGNASGLSTGRVKLFDQDSPGISGAPESEDYFASALAAGDFNGDGVDDLVVGMRSEAVGSATGSGASMILFGNTTGGITTKGALWVDQDTEGVPGTMATDDHFGWTVGALDTDGNGRVTPGRSTRQRGRHGNRPQGEAEHPGVRDGPRRGRLGLVRRQRRRRVRHRAAALTQFTSELAVRFGRRAPAPA